MTKSIHLVNSVIENPDKKSATQALETHVRHHSMNKSERWKKLLGALLLFVGATALAWSIVSTPFSAGSSIALGGLGVMIIATGVGFWSHRESTSPHPLSFAPAM